MIDRATIEALAANYKELMRLIDERQKTQAKMVRACIAELNKNTITTKRQVIAALTTLAKLMEGK